MSDYIKRSDLASDMSALLISPWALEGGAVSVGISEALHMVQDIANDEVPDNFRLPDYDVVEVVRCKDCKLWSSSLTKEEKQVLIDTNTDGVCEVWMSDGLMPNDFCSYGQRKEGEG